MARRIISILCALILISCSRQEMRRDATTVGSYSRVSGVSDGVVALKKAPRARLQPGRSLQVGGETRRKAPEMMSRYGGDKLKALPLRSHDIHVVVVGHRVRVVQDLVFENPSDEMLSGKIMIELPGGASPSYLGMFMGTGGKLDRGKKLSWLNPKPQGIKGLLGRNVYLKQSWKEQGQVIEWGALRARRVINPVKGRRVYESITRRKVDPALAEWAGANKFSTRIYPVMPRSFKRVVFAYEKSLRADESYRLPVPRKVKAKTRVTVHLAGKGGANAYLKGVGRGKNTKFGKTWRYRPAAGRPGAPVLQRGASRKLQYLVGRDEKVKGKLVHIRYRPIPKTVGLEKTETGRAVFLLDTSYSVKKGLYNPSARMLKEILKRDKSIREFAVVAFDVRTTALTRGFRPNTWLERAKLTGTMRKIRLDGATNFDAVLEHLQKNSKLAKADAFFLLSDGFITWGRENPVDLERRYPALFKQRWLCYSFGNQAVNQGLFRQLSRARGRILSVAASQPLKAAALAHLYRGAELLSLKGGWGDEIPLAGAPRFLYPGQVLEISAQVSRLGAGSLKLKLDVGGESHEVKVPLRVRDLTAGIAARAWAGLYTERLLDLHTTKADETALALSQRFSLSNRAASFIILETDAEYKQHKIVAANLDLKKLKQQGRSVRKPSPGLPDLNKLGPDGRKLLQQLEQAGSGRVWRTRAAVASKSALFQSLSGTRKGARSIYKQAKSLYKRKRYAAALRVLSTIVEKNPRDARSLRMTAFVLMEWGFYKEAAGLFAVTRRRRPFESQNYLLEAMARASAGQRRQAAHLLEASLIHKDRRFSSFSRPAANILYRDLLESLQRGQSSNFLRKLAANRRKKVDAKKKPAGSLLLFWNLDDTDMDLHVREPISHVYYKNKSSLTGGRLFFDNTAGLGPEIYEHPRMSLIGFKVDVHYFGSRSVQGQAPATALLCAFNYNRGKVPVMNCKSTILTNRGRTRILKSWR